ncbi:amino acid ABC transporter permease [Kiloniella litopenaei]|uniref:amino acid ABC transporter permease n=1 Tax=Kiloniella litopenaei TaxID=1549748 RepID=UPI000698AD1A|nr:ABC transporter permease subunit [Kiloniella litopenaei]
MSKSTSARLGGLFSYRNLLSCFYQTLTAGIVIACAYYLLLATQENLEARHIESGFSFLSQEAGFPIGDSLISYSPSDTYGRALLVGIINTFFAAILCIIFATILGIVMGVAQVSGNPLIARMAEVYVEVMRNIPVLLILLFVYGVVLVGLPSVKQAIEFIPDGFLSQRGIFVPRPIAGENFIYLMIALGLGIVGTVFFLKWAKKTLDITGKSFPTIWISLALIIIPPVIIQATFSDVLTWEVPELKGFNFKGGWVFRPEFAALVFGLVLYRGAFIAENVRSGIVSVQKGQREAATALGLSPERTMRDVVLPQALRTVIPSTTNDYASLVKDSSLAIAIGFPDMVSVGGTMIGQNGQAIEVIAIWMGIYLCINLIISLLMNIANNKFQLVER